MMDWTDRYCRGFHRQISRHALLYTEMVTADAVIHGDRDRLLGFDSTEQPVALQLGGADPVAMDHGIRRDHFGVQQRVSADLAVNPRQYRSVQSIMGATDNLYD
jgi:hypothetical protein